MQCLNCDRSLALLKRLTGDGEFCSKECRKVYQREHNQLGLERLLENQPASNRKTSQRRPPIEIPEETPIPVVEEPPERLPEPAGFLPSYPQEATVVSGVRWLAGDPR